MIRFGIVGFGLHGDRRLMPGFALSQKCKVVALSRRDPQKAAESARRYSIPHAFTSTEELCRCPEVDAVLVTSPDVLHRADTLTAIGAGKPVLCEKPMAMNAEECRDMVEAARQANVLLGVAHVFRFEESTARLRDHIAKGAIGQPVTARAEFSYLGTGHGRTWLYNPEMAAGGPVAGLRRVPDQLLHDRDHLGQPPRDGRSTAGRRPLDPDLEPAAADDRLGAALHNGADGRLPEAG